MPPATLFVVATPIGNLEDISLRALRILKEVAVIAAEDTRRTAKLLSHYTISKKAISFHQHNAHLRLPLVVSRLLAGDSVALVTDAGTPGISDPGAELVRACVAAGIGVDSIPGPTAPIAAAVVSGFPLNPFTILGFVPTRPRERKDWLIWSSNIIHSFSFFESPHRIASTMAIGANYFGLRPILVAREVTKLHQEFIRGSAEEIVASLDKKPRGEFTVIVGPAEPTSSAKTVPETTTQRQLADEFYLMTKTGSSRRVVVASLARKHGISVREAYSAIEKSKADAVI